MNYVVLNQDGTDGVREYEDGKGYETLLQIVGTGKDYDGIDSPVGIARFTDADVQKESDKIDAELIASLGGNGFLLHAYMHENGRSLFRHGEVQENKYLSDRGWKGVYGNVAVCAQFEHSETGDPVEIPSSSALQMAKIIMESKGKSLDSLYSERGEKWAKDAEMSRWFSARMADFGGQVDMQTFLEIQKEGRRMFGLDHDNDDEVRGVISFVVLYCSSCRAPSAFLTADATVILFHVSFVFIVQGTEESNTGGATTKATAVTTEQA